MKKTGDNTEKSGKPFKIDDKKGDEKTKDSNKNKK
jgi:hypothetical protein